MAELAFEVKANYDEVIRLRQELERLRGEMLRTGDSTEEERKQMERLEAQYEQTEKAMGDLVDQAAEAGTEMEHTSKQAQKASVSAQGLADTVGTVKGALNTYIKAQKASGDMDEESAKKAQKLVSILGGLEGILKVISTAQQNYKAQTAASATATTAESAATNGLAAAQVGATATTVGLTTSVRSLNAAMMANPIGLALSLIPMVISFISSAGDETDSTTREIREMNKETKKQLDNLDELITTIETTGERTRAHKDAVDEVNEMCKEYNVTLLNENDTLEQQKVKYQQLEVAIRNANAAKIGEKYIDKAQEKAEKQDNKSLNRLKRAAQFSGNADLVGISDDVWEQIALRAQSGADTLAGLSGAAYDAKFKEMVDDISKSIRANSKASAFEVERFQKKIQSYVKSLDGTRRDLDKRTKQIQKSTEQFLEGGNEEENPLDLATASFDALEAEWGRLATDIADESKAANKSANEARRAETETAMTEKAIQGTRKELKERKSRLEKEIDEAVEGGEQQKKLQSLVDAINAELKTRKGEDDPKGGNKKDPAEREAERQAAAREKAYTRYESQITKLIQQVEGNISKEEISQIEDHEVALEAALEAERQALLAKAKEIADAISEQTDPKKIAEMQSQYDALVEAIERLIRTKRENAKEDQWEAERAAMNAYLKEYGTVEERKAAINAEYEEKIRKARASGLDGEVLSLTRQSEDAIRKLEQAYDTNYSLIFANADSLTDTMLSQAIDKTQQAIEEAKESGDIQALTNLYARLREQMGESRERGRGWGFSGIAEGFGLRAEALDKRSLADELEKSLAAREKGLDLMKSLGVDEEKVEVARKKIAELRAEIAKLREDATQDDQDALGFLEKGFSEVASAFSQLGAEMASFRDGMNGTADAIADIGEGLSGLASHAGEIQKAFSEGGMSKGDAWSTIISGTIELVSMVGHAIQRNKKAQEEWNRTIEEADHRYKMLQLDRLDYKPSNIFGVEDPFKKATAGAEKYRKSMEEITALTGALAGGKVQTGTKKVVDWGNVGKGAGTGAAVGAAVGSIIPGLGTAIGTAIGAAVGAIAGALSTKVVPVFESLQEHYGQLFDPETFELNDRLLADYDKLDEDTKQIVDHWDEIKKKAEEARKELKDNLKEFTGDLGKKLEDTIVNAWKSHRLYSAVDDYKRYVGQQIASILEQQAFSSVFEGLFNDLGKRMEDSFLGPEADNSIIDDLDDFNQKFPQYLDAYGQLMDQLNGELQEMGYEGFRDRQSNAEATTKSFQQISETTGSAIQGGVTALRLSSEVRNQHLSLINENLTDMLLNQMRSVTIAEDVRNIQAEAYLALVAIRDNTAGNLRAVQNIEGLVDRIEKNTREL